jgi:tRNA threonylcarbamoyl adenosine modification protein YeaZ
MILVIDTSSSHVTVSIINDNTIVHEFKKKIDNDIASKIMSIINMELTESDIDIKDIDRIFVVNGPGSFTGVRIGVTIAKTMAWALNIKVTPISSLELMATTQSNKKFIVPLIDARRGNVYAGVYDKDLNTVLDDKLISISEILRFETLDYEFVSYDEIKGIETIKPNTDILKIVNKHINDDGIIAHELKPNYLKLTEAEENRLKND